LFLTLPARQNGPLFSVNFNRYIMALYTFTFNGRLVGAIGAFSQHMQTVRANNEGEGRMALYNTHEHLTGVVLLSPAPANKPVPDWPVVVPPLADHYKTSLLVAKQNPRPPAWLWPDRVIGKRQSAIMRQEYNALLNKYCRLVDAVEAAGL
jgi:hypothetical protein